jgi:hypothetical protein
MPGFAPFDLNNEGSCDAAEIKMHTEECLIPDAHDETGCILSFCRGKAVCNVRPTEAEVGIEDIR